MAIRKYKPTTPGRRGSSVADFADVTRDHPEKSLVRPLHGRGGPGDLGEVGDTGATAARRRRLVLTDRHVYNP